MGQPRELRAHQVELNAGLRDAVRTGSRRPVVQAPTGSGKTVLAAHIVWGARRKNNRVTFTVPSLGLIDQTFDRFVENGIDPAEMGIIQADHPWRRPHAPIQIASVQTLARREFPLCDVVVVDECHIMHEVVHKWMAEKPELIFIGLTATPWAKAMGKHYDRLVKAVSLADMIARGWLTPPRTFAPSHPDLEGVKIVAGDYAEDELADRMMRTKIVADVVSTWAAKAGPSTPMGAAVALHGLPTLCFCVNRAHAKLVHDQFEGAGVRSAYCDANTPRDERERLGRALKTGELQVVCNIGTLTTGIDWDVRCIILARPTKSEILFVQIIGRGLRPVYPNGVDPLLLDDDARAEAIQAGPKPYCLVLDHSDTTLRLGMVDEIDHDELHDGKPRKKSTKEEDEEKELGLPRECKSCGELVPAKVEKCPSCGYVMRRPARVSVVDGELEELSPDSTKRARRVKPAAVIPALQDMGQREVWGQILTVKEQRGWSDGRAAHMFRSIFDTWPNSVRNAPQREPSAELFGWIRMKAIAYAKAMGTQQQ